VKVYITHYFVEDGEAGINGVFLKKADAEKRLKLLIEGTYNPDEPPTKKELAADIKKALKDGFFEYSGSGCGPNPWYALTEEEVQCAHYPISSKRSRSPRSSSRISRTHQVGSTTSSCRSS
jgi:hypothetical protein